MGILWRGLEDEAAPVFVVYKLLHEAFSNSPSFFRRFISSLMASQPDRFSTVFSRETLWSVVARIPGYDISEDWASVTCISRLLEVLNKKCFWRRSDAELDRDAKCISAALTGPANEKFKSGVEALRRLQTDRATGLTYGNLVLQVPAKLNQYVSEVVEQGMHGHLPELKEIRHKIHEIVRDPLTEARHQSIPIDLLFSDLNGDNLECFLLVRKKANEAAQVAFRKQSLLLRYFLKFAFSSYGMEQLNVRLAFYLDPRSTFAPLPKPAALFHPEEMVEFAEFWEIVSGNPSGASLILKVRDSAAAKLKSSALMAQIKEHMNRDRKPNAANKRNRDSARKHLLSGGDLREFLERELE